MFSPRLPTCPTCQSRDAEFVESQQCTLCLQAQILASEEALAWQERTFAQERVRAEQAWASTPSEGRAALVYALEDKLVESLNGGFSVDYRAFVVLDGLKEVFRAAPTSGSNEGAETLPAFIDAALNMGYLRQTAFHLRDGRCIVARGISPVRLQPRFSFGPEVVLTRRSHEWRNWTLVAMGRVPGDEPELRAAILRNEPEASLLALAVSLGLRAYDLEALRLRQDVKAVLAALDERLRRLSRPEAQRLTDFCWSISERVRDEAGEGAGVLVAPQRQFEEVIARAGWADAARLVQSDREECVVPVVHKIGNEYVAPGRILNWVGRLSSNYHPSLQGTTTGDNAGATFERIVHARLGAAGLTAALEGGTPTINLTPGGKKWEIDSLVWSSSDVLLVDSKYEPEPPGAWYGEQTVARVERLQGYRATALNKLERFRQVLSSRRPIAYQGTQELVLPQGLLKGRTLRILIVSARVEPEVPAGPIPVKTFMPSLAAAVAAKRLVGAPVCPIWDGRSVP